MMNIDLEGMRDAGKLRIEQVDAAEMSPGEFAHLVRRTANEEHIKNVVIDSLNGYQAAMPEESSLILHIHELLQYLNRQGVATFLTMAQHGMFDRMAAPTDVTYIADTVVLLRYFEAQGHVKRAMSCIKKRTGAHENTIREYRHRRGRSEGAGALDRSIRAFCVASPRSSAARARPEAARGEPLARVPDPCTRAGAHGA